MINLFGASGHAKIIIEIAQLNGIQIKAIYDDNETIQEILGYPVSLARNDEIKSCIIAIGNNKIRKEIASRVISLAKPLVHQSSILSDSVVIGKGTVIMAGAVVNSSVTIRENVIINTRAVIEHDVEIANFAHVSPNATIAGGVKIGEGTHIGAGAVVIPNVSIGKWATIGAGAVIIKDVPDYATVVGNPGRIIKTK